jgi:hypothetical protein
VWALDFVFPTYLTPPSSSILEHSLKWIYVIIFYSIYTYNNRCLCMCVCVCMSGHNSGTPVAISTKLGTHIAICMYKNLMYVLYIFRREDGVGGREFG